MPTGRFVAVKVFKVKYASKAKAYENKEVKILRKFQSAEEKKKGSHSPYVMKAIDIIYENGKLHIVFELMELNLTQFIRKRKSESLKRFDEGLEIKVISKQLLMGMQYLNEELGIMHRDIKPDNIMVNSNPLSIKIIDFGTSKDCLTNKGPHTSYVSTRWYRAPECILRSHNYTMNSDIFAVGCVIAELYLMHPLFPGVSELDQLEKVFKVLGTPKKDQWREGYKLAEKHEITFTEYPKKNLMSIMPYMTEDAHEAMKMMLKISSQKRGSASQVLLMQFFKQDITPLTQVT